MTRVHAHLLQSASHALAMLAAAIALTSPVPAGACGAPTAVQQVAGAGYAAVRLLDGSVWLEGRPGARPDSPERTLARVPLWRDIVQLAADGPHLYARQADGRVWHWVPSEAAPPRPVRGLPARAIELAADDTGAVVVHLQPRPRPDQAAGIAVVPLAAPSITLRLAGPIALPPAAAEAAGPARAPARSMAHATACAGTACSGRRAVPPVAPALP